MKTENEFLIELVDLIAENGIDSALCEFVYRETALVQGRDSKPKIFMSDDSVQICRDIYSIVIGDVCMGYTVTKHTADEMIDEITNYILITQKG